MSPTFRPNLSPTKPALVAPTKKPFEYHQNGLKFIIIGHRSDYIDLIMINSCHLEWFSILHQWRAVTNKFIMGYQCWIYPIILIGIYWSAFSKMGSTTRTQIPAPDIDRWYFRILSRYDCYKIPTWLWMCYFQTNQHIRFRPDLAL